MSYFIIIDKAMKSERGLFIFLVHDALLHTVWDFTEQAKDLPGRSVTVYVHLIKWQEWHVYKNSISKIGQSVNLCDFILILF